MLSLWHYERIVLKSELQMIVIRVTASRVDLQQIRLSVVVSTPDLRNTSAWHGLQSVIIRACLVTVEY